MADVYAADVACQVWFQTLSCMVCSGCGAHSFTATYGHSNRAVLNASYAAFAALKILNAYLLATLINMSGDLMAGSSIVICRVLFSSPRKVKYMC